MNLFTFRGMLVLSCLGAAALHFKPWQHVPSRATGAVTGRAVDSDGRAVSGASVVLRDKQGVIVGRTESEANGVFSFEGCRAGRYRVAAGKLGVGGGERGIVVNRGDRAEATIPLTGHLTGVSYR